MKKLLTMLALVLIVLGCDHVGPLPPTFGPAVADTDDADDDSTELAIGECAKGAYNGDFDLITLDDMVELAGHTSISGYFSINCDTCADFDALSCLTSVGEYLNIYGTVAVTDLDGLDSLTSVGGSVHIYNNLALPDCESCTLLGQLTSESDSILIHDNQTDACSPAPDSC